jgi:hypothetical protein
MKVIRLYAWIVSGLIATACGGSTSQLSEENSEPKLPRYNYHFAFDNTEANRYISNYFPTPSHNQSVAMKLFHHQIVKSIITATDMDTGYQQTIPSSGPMFLEVAVSIAKERQSRGRLESIRPVLLDEIGVLNRGKESLQEEIKKYEAEKKDAELHFAAKIITKEVMEATKRVMDIHIGNFQHKIGLLDSRLEKLHALDQAFMQNLVQ